MGFEGDISLDLRDVFDGMDDISRASRNLRPAWDVLKPIMKKDQRLHVTRREGPDGKWPKSAESTRDKQFSASKKTAGRTGRRPPKRPSSRQLGTLRTKFAIKTGRQVMRAEDTIRNRKGFKFGGVHQPPKGVRFTQVGKGAKVPARVHRWLSDEFLAIAFKVIEQHVFGPWDKGGRRRR